MAETAWVIEQGEYSDYRVVGVFTSRENAERIAEKINGDRTYDLATVDEWLLDPGIQALNQGHHRYHVLMLRDGTTESVEREVSPWFLSNLVSEFFIWSRSTAPAPHLPDALRASVWAGSDAHAVKVVNERRLQMIASGEWEAS
jgi:hypothetical protein